MRINEDTVVCGEKVVLVPYRREHVQTYHEWMKSPELLELTASEPLSWEEELDMQQKWHLDEDKLTFILLERPSPDSSASPTSSTSPGLSPLPPPAQIRQYRMVGDVNLFLPDGKGGDAECEIMIAGKSAPEGKEDRRRGFAGEAMRLFLAYAITTLQLRPTSLIARIGLSNTASINLFRKLGFGVVKVVRFWNEVEMRWGYPGINQDAEADEAPRNEGVDGESEAEGEEDWPEEERRRKDQEWDLRLPDGCTTTFDDPAKP